MEKTIQHEITGIQCDSCDWKDMSISSDDYSEWINEPCPKCGANLLTEADYNASVAFKKSIDMINSMSVEELEKFNEQFLNNASNDQMNDMIDMMEGMGNVSDNEDGKPINVSVTSKDGKIKFNKPNDEKI